MGSHSTVNRFASKTAEVLPSVSGVYVTLTIMLDSKQQADFQSLCNRATEKLIDISPHRWFRHLTHRSGYVINVSSIVAMVLTTISFQFNIGMGYERGTPLVMPSWKTLLIILSVMIAMVMGFLTTMLFVSYRKFKPFIISTVIMCGVGSGLMVFIDRYLWRKLATTIEEFAFPVWAFVFGFWICAVSFLAWYVAIVIAYLAVSFARGLMWRVSTYVKGAWRWL